MKNSSKALGLIVLLLGVTTFLCAQDRAHDIAKQAPNQHPATCPRTSVTLQDCHTKFPDGCSASAPAHYDAYLDFLKGQDPDPAMAPTKALTSAADFQKLEAQLPKGGKSKGKSKGGLGSTNHASFATQFAGLGEGNIYSVIAYLYFVEDTGKGTACQGGVAETTNCKITAPDSADYHLGLGFNSTLASKARTAQPCTPGFSALEKDSFVAEMTPYPRQAHHPKWTIANISAHRGEQVKVVGQLMIDNDHFQARDDCALPGAAANCWRSTVWEIHPITGFYVCKLAAGCTQSSPDSDWNPL
jgi:hypothetical protein